MEREGTGKKFIKEKKQEARGIKGKDMGGILSGRSMLFYLFVTIQNALESKLTD
jgi:hypothetical protein